MPWISWQLFCSDCICSPFSFFTRDRQSPSVWGLPFAPTDLHQDCGELFAITPMILGSKLPTSVGATEAHSLDRIAQLFMTQGSLDRLQRFVKDQYRVNGVTRRDVGRNTVLGAVLGLEVGQQLFLWALRQGFWSDDWHRGHIDALGRRTGIGNEGASTISVAQKYGKLQSKIHRVLKNDGRTGIRTPDYQGIGLHVL